MIVLAERLGFHGVWVPQIRGFDAMTVLAVAAAGTNQLLLGTSVVPIWPRHPVATAQQAVTVSSIADGRFRLGLGASHPRIIEEQYGLKFGDPVGHLEEYVKIIRALANTGSASLDGRHFSVKVSLETRRPGMPVMIAALSPRMCRLAGALADGVITWLAPPNYICDVIVPNVVAGAAIAGREAPPVIAEVPACVTGDPAVVRSSMKRLFSAYPVLEFYRSMFLRAGITDVGRTRRGEWTSALIDAVVPHGDEEQLLASVATYKAAGVDEIVFAAVPFGDDWDASLDLTMKTLAAVAARS
jgi:F420-dependent oxidoreductase-like protein